MTALALPNEEPIAALPALIDRAASALINARSAAEVLEAHEMAGVAYDMAKRAARLAKAKSAHDELIGAAYRAQAHALEIEAQAKRRLADEYDAAQERGDVQKHGGQGKRDVPAENIPSVQDIGLTRKAIHEARTVRDAERADPGIVSRTLTERVERGEEPTKSHLRAVVAEAAQRGLQRAPTPRSTRNPMHEPNPRLDALLSVLGSCRSISGKLETYAAEALVAAFVDPAMRAREIGAIRQARDDLTAILEAADAE